MLETDVTLKRGETLHVEVAWRDSNTGTQVLADETYGIEAIASKVQTGPGTLDLGPVIANGKGVIAYDTSAMDCGDWYFDIRLILPVTLEKVYSRTFRVHIDPSLTQDVPDGE
jgi:hypothetical protein